jgi:hypothetical protein
MLRQPSPSSSVGETNRAMTSPPTKRRALSTERSRLCRQRQKVYADDLARHVQSLRDELSSLALLRDLRREQSLQTPRSPAGSAARIVREYCALFQHGIRPAAPTFRSDVSPLPAGSKRSRTELAAVEATASVQREFLTSIMSPDLQVFDWLGRSAIGTGTLVNGWEAWAAWHASLSFELQRVHVVDTSTDDESGLLVVQTESLLRVVVNDTTLTRLFPHAARDPAMRRRLLGQEIRYKMKDTFYFSARERRVVKYSCDLDFVGALLPVVGDLETALFLVTPPDSDSLNDLAVRTTPADIANRSPLDIAFLLT